MTYEKSYILKIKEIEKIEKKLGYSIPDNNTKTKQKRRFLEKQIEIFEKN